MSILVDTNVLLRRTQPAHPQHTAAIGAVKGLLDDRVPLYFTMQNMTEFWNVATRPAASNGLGFSIRLTIDQIELIESVMELLPDASEIYEEWKRLVVRHEVRGVQVHDTKLVAAMNVHGIRQLLTFNVQDFVRFGIDVLNPATLTRDSE